MVKQFRILKLFIWINETNTEYILFVYKGALKAVNLQVPFILTRDLLWEICFIFRKLIFKMGSKPPLSSRVACLCAAELGIKDNIGAKVVFTRYRSNSRI